jgi:replication initiation and membrane attachment protein DnaB
MLNHDFWITFLSLPYKALLLSSRGPKAYYSATDRSTAIGFVRSYAFLVQNELDFCYEIFPPEAIPMLVP